jgi:phosphoglycerate dehydrogenase-like enzyme
MVQNDATDIDGSLPLEWFKTSDKASLHAFLGKCDVVIDCLPGGQETQDFIAEAELKAMKDTAILVNVGRGSECALKVL